MRYINLRLTYLLTYLLTLRPSHLTWAVSPPVGCYRLQPPSPFIIITQPEKLILIYRPTEGRRLSWPGHCRKVHTAHARGYNLGHGLCALSCSALVSDSHSILPHSRKATNFYFQVRKEEEAELAWVHKADRERVQQAAHVGCESLQPDHCAKLYWLSIIIEHVYSP